MIMRRVVMIMMTIIMMLLVMLSVHVHKVFNSSVELTRYVFSEFIPKHKKLGKNETSQAVDRILPELMARISDTVSINCFRTCNKIVAL